MITRFIITGIINTGATYLIYIGLLQYFTYYVAYSVAFILGILISYILNAMFVFRAGISKGTFIRFPALYIFQYLLGLAIISTLVEMLGVPAWLAPLLAIAVTVPVTFILARSIFTSNKRGSGVGCA